MANLISSLEQAIPAASAAAAARWLALAKGNAVNAASAAGKAKLAKRPSSSTSPIAIEPWLNSSPGFSPFFVFPEWPWKASGDNATAAYSLGSNDNVQWTADSEGGWTYNHQYGGTDLGTIIGDAASALGIAADLTGFAFLGMFVSVAKAVANHEPLESLGQALKADWDRTSNAAQLAFAVMDGDWAQAWDHATSYGSDLSGIVSAFAPGPAPDRSGNLTITAKAPAPKPPPPPAPTKAAPKMNIQLHGVTTPGGANIGNILGAAQAAGISPAQQLMRSLGITAAAAAPTPKAPAPPPAAVPWYSKPLVGPITVGMAGIGVAALGVLAKVAGK